MWRERVAQAMRLAGFGVLLVATSTIREGPSTLDMAVVWLPTGVAIAGVFILGLPTAAIVGLATLVQRFLIGYDWGVALGAAAGSSTEAVLGALVLSRLGVQRTFTRLADVGAVLVAAVVAPLGSILCSGLARAWLWDRDMPFYSGWDGWWRMNALAAAMVLPAVLSWRSTPPDAITSRLVARVGGGLAGITALLLVLLPLLPRGAVGVLWLNLVLVGVAMAAAARFGMRGASLGTLVAGIVVIVATNDGVGPFIDLPRAERHVALQLVELALVALPSAFAAMLAERRTAEEAVRRSEALLTSINQNVQDGIFRMDARQHIVYANRALARMFGIDDPGALLGTPLAEAFASPTRRAALVEVLRRGEPVQSEEVELRRAGGTTFWALVSGMAVRDASGAVSHYDGAITDVTARKTLEAQVRESQKLEAVGRLAGGIAHDFNNLLTVILGYSEALRDTTPPNDPAAENAIEIHAAAKRAAVLTRQLLAYSRRQVMAPQVLDACDVVASVTGMLRRIIGEDVRLVVRASAEPCWVRVDRNQLEQVLVNLAVNARDAMARGGTLTVSASLDRIDEESAVAHPDRTAGPCVLIRVHDTGIGMDAAVLAQAFEPFFTTKAVGQGTGLGLASVYGIVRQSGGSVWLESAPGKGTTAFVALPRATAPAGSPVSTPQVHSSTGHWPS